VATFQNTKVLLHKVEKLIKTVIHATQGLKNLLSFGWLLNFSIKNFTPKQHPPTNVSLAELAA
jgi:hypothetical protein